MPETTDSSLPTLLRARASERHYDLHVLRNLTRNYSLHLAHGLLGQTGFRLVNAPTFMPAYILLLSGGSDLAVGVVLSIQALGMTMSPLFGANLISHRKRVLPMGMLTGGCMRAMVLCIALSGLLLPAYWALFAIAVFLGLFGLFMGVQGVVFHFLFSKVIPVRRRGQLTGLRNFLSGIIASAVAWVAGEFLIGESPAISGYSHTFLLAFVLTSIGLCFLLFVREPEPPIMRDPASLIRRLREIPHLLHSAPGFGLYVCARAIANAGRMAMPFYILFVGIDLDLSGQTLGLLTFAFMLSSTLSNLFWGTIADRTGFRFVMLAGIGLWILSTLVLLMVTGLWPTMLVFAGIGAGFQGFQSAAMNMTLEFGNRQDLPMRIAVANTAAEFAGILGPVLGGFLASTISYTATFGASVAFLAIGGFFLLSAPEPRIAKPPP